MGLVVLGPEVGHAESLFEVGAEIPHVTNREEDVEAELGESVSLGAAQIVEFGRKDLL